MTGYTDLSDRAWLRLTGPDAVRFLNGQVTNDVSQDLSGRVIPACVCSIKGKAEALVWITADPDSSDGLLIEAEAAQIEAVHMRIDRYLIADDCELSEPISDLTVAHYIGDVPLGGAAVKECWRYGVKGYDLHGTSEATGLDRNDLAQAALLSGVPSFGAEITGDYHPVELGLDKWAVDFHKGCYLGQEIVSRLETAGKSRNEWGIYLGTDEHSAGAEIANADGRVVGKVTRDSLAYEGRYLTAIMVRGELGDSFEKLAFREMG